ncbi:hypothetical protein [Halorubrum distributum]|nr:hypothetical protein [Halorubrum distributum]
MDRRKFVVGLGALASGAAAAMGTGAFTSVTANRDAEIDLEDDANAYLALTPGNDNGWAASPTVGNSANGVLAIEMNGQSQTSGGTGVNADALSVFDDVFRIGNQADSGKQVWIEFDEASGSTTNQSNINYKARTDFYVGSHQSSPPLQRPSNSLVGSSNAQTVGTGNNLKVGISIDLTGLSPSDYATDSNGNLDTGQFLRDITIHAEDVSGSGT